MRREGAAETEQVDALIIGAGASGIGAAPQQRAVFPRQTLTSVIRACANAEGALAVPRQAGWLRTLIWAYG